MDTPDICGLGVPLVAHYRCGIPEVVHYGSLSISHCDGRQTGCGNTGIEVPVRSTGKPFILISLLETVLSSETFSAEELALMTSSHNGEPRHVALVRELLRKYGVAESELRCGVHERFCADSEVTPVGNQCSGKHALFLISCKLAGWHVDDYRSQDGPLQKAIAPRLRRLLCTDRVSIGIDGCSIPTYGIPLNSLSMAYAKLADGASDAGRRVVAAMQTAPFFVAGTGCLDSHLNHKYGLVAKSGSDGVWAIGVPHRQLGFAVKAVSGDEPAAQAVLVEALERFSVLRIAEDAFIETFFRRTALSLTGDPVGEIRSCLPDFPIM